LTGAEITWVTPEQYQEREKVFEAVENALRAQGETPFRIPEGGSNATGVFGYRRCYQEILEQCRELEISPEFIYVAVGSGGTLGGLLAGWAKNQFEGPIPVGIPVCDDSVFFRAKINQLLEMYHERWGAPIPDSEQIQMIDGFVGDGYAKSRPEELEELISLARLEGLLLDPVYTLKAFLGARAHRLVGDRREKSAIFIHTGGLFGLFGAKDSLPEL
jgi:D-cysteine desulfhydrase